MTEPSPRFDFGRNLAARSGVAVGIAILLLLASLGLAIHNERQARIQFDQQLAVRAHILANSVTAALAFDDRQTAQGYFDALRTDPQIAAAGAYDGEGRLFAGFALPGATLPPARTVFVSSPEEGRRAITVPVTQNGTRLGSVYLSAATEPWTSRTSRYVGIGLILLMAALLVAGLGSSYASATAANRRLQDEMEARREAEEALRQAQKMEAMGQLTGGVAHDFNNLLMVASSGLELLERVQEPERRERVKQGIRQAIDRGAKLTQQLLTFARRSPVNPEVIDLGGRVAALRDMLDRSLREDIRVEIDMPDGLWPVEVDVAQLEVALLNIALNARDAMPEGGTIHIAARNQPGGTTGRDQLCLTVRDEGAGMAPHLVVKAFEPFFTTKGVGRGTGLGLSQVYGFARSSGGTALIESEEGKGTTVTILLPRSFKQPVQPVPEPVVEASARKTRNAVLLVEDDSHVAELLVDMLDELGYSADWKLNAADALAALESGVRPDLLLSDMVMPGAMNGLDLARTVRRKWPDMPVLLMTGYSAAASAVAREDIELLTKPYRMEQLREKLDALLR
ncbi:MAG TPA: ATP-binding protein [Sphingobium sp.]|nr:ATP-binding protein [Sphingobium sp.]